jgi:tripartite-type tricarboxylate transporter receptor subunit TctC
MIKSHPRVAIVALAAITTIIAVGPSRAEPVADFYKGRALTILVPSGAGGLNALYARTVGDRLGKHIPGNPKVIYQYMPGGGGIKGTNYCFNIAPKDGSMICEPLNPLALAQLLRPRGVKYDAGKFNYLGNASNMNGSFAVWETVKIKTLLDARNTEVILSGTGKGSESYYDPTIVNNLFGTKFKLVMGYKGGGALDLSLERGETSGRAGPLLSWVVRKPHWLKSGKIRILAQVGLKRMPDFADVPLLTDFAETAEQRQILGFISSRAAIGRPFVAPPGTPPDRVAALRSAFIATMKDPEFLADVKKRRLYNEWSSGAEVQKIVANMLATPRPLIRKIQAVLGYK